MSIRDKHHQTNKNKQYYLFYLDCFCNSITANQR